MTSTTSPTATRNVTSIAAILAVALAANLAILGLASLAGAALVADNAGTAMEVTVGAVAAASILPLLVAVAGFLLVARRVALVRRAWTPVIAGLGILSLAGTLAAEDLATTVALAAMHLVVAGLAAFALPRAVEAG